MKVQLFFSFSRLTKKKIKLRKIFVSFFFIFVSTQTPKRKSLNADVLSHVREFTVHREEEEEEDRGGGV